MCGLFKNERVVGGVEYDIPRDENQAEIKVTRQLGGWDVLVKKILGCLWFISGAGLGMQDHLCTLVNGCAEIWS